jgi:hypothetical protein
MADASERTTETTSQPIGKRVRIIRCEAREHGDNEGCVCYLIGGVEHIAKLFETPFAGTPTYHLAGRRQRVRLCEVEIMETSNA